jgi:hypothetical protein
VHPLFLVEEDYRLALLDAEAAFIEGFIERITGRRVPTPRITSRTGTAKRLGESPLGDSLP